MTPELPNPEPQVLALRVTNFNDFPLQDRFDGTLFQFQQNIPKDIPIDAAHHIFGWFPPYRDRDGVTREVDPDIMRAHCQRRFGWNTPQMVGSGAADEFFKRLVFRPIMYRMTPVLIDEDENKPALNPEAPSRAPKVNKMMAAADEAAQRR